MIGLSVLDMVLPNIEQYGWATCIKFFLVGWGAIMILARWTDGLDDWANNLYPDNTNTNGNDVSATTSGGHHASSSSPRKTTPSSASNHDGPRRQPSRVLSGTLSRSGSMTGASMSRSSSAVDEDDDMDVENGGRHMMPTEAPLTAAPLAFDKQLRAKRVKGAILTTVALALHNAPVRSCSCHRDVCVCVCVCTRVRVR
jgi:hypothetical protein